MDVFTRTVSCRASIGVYGWSDSRLVTLDSKYRCAFFTTGLFTIMIPTIKLNDQDGSLLSYVSREDLVFFVFMREEPGG